MNYPASSLFSRHFMVMPESPASVLLQCKNNQLTPSPSIFHLLIIFFAMFCHLIFKLQNNSPIRFIFWSASLTMCFSYVPAVRSKTGASHSEKSREASSQRVQRQPSATRGQKAKSSGSSSSSSQINST